MLKIKKNMCAGGGLVTGLELMSVILRQQGTGILEADWRLLIHSGSECVLAEDSSVLFVG